MTRKTSFDVKEKESCDKVSNTEYASESAKSPLRKPSRAERMAELQEEALAIEQEEEAAQKHNAMARDVASSINVLQPVLRGQFMVLQQLIPAWNQHQGFWESANRGEKIALMHSELSEMLEAVRKHDGQPSEHIPAFTAEEEELADLLIRAFDYAGFFNLRLADAFHAKLLFNLERPFKHGKQF